MEYTAGTCVTTGSVILLDSIRNPARIMATWKITFRVPMGCLGTWQIVGMLHAGNEKGLENQDSLLKDKTGAFNVVLLLQLLFTTVVDLII